MANRTKVQIYDQTYTLAGDLDAAYVTELARYVDEKMRSVADETQTVDSLRVAILAALAIADELHSMRQSEGQRDQSFRERDEALRERAERCLTLVERALKQSA